MENLFSYILFALAFFILGWKLREVYAKMMLARLHNAVEKVIEQKQNEKKDVINATIEKHDGHLFIYKQEDGSYLAHAENKNKLTDMLHEKFPGKMFNVSQEDLEKLDAK